MNGTDMHLVRTVATDVRDMVCTAAHRRGMYQDGFWDSTLAGLCGIASDLLIRELKPRKIDAKLAYGRFRFCDGKCNFPHCWVQCGDNCEYIVDITATQFGEQFPEVFITSLVTGSGHRWRRIYWPLALGGSAYAHVMDPRWPDHQRPGALDSWIQPPPKS